MSYIFEFMDDIKVSLFADWVDIENLAVLDSAICNQADRPQFLQIISSRTFHHTTAELHDHPGYIIWLIERNNFVQSISLSNKHKISDEYRMKYFKSLKHLKLLKMMYSSALLFFIENCCNEIGMLDLSESDDLSDEELLWLLKNVVGLKKLNISDCESLTVQSALNIAQHVPNLEYLNCEGCPNFLNDALLVIAQSCHKLTGLSICQEESFSTELFLALGTNCGALTKLDQCVALLRGCVQLTHLDISGCAELTDFSITKIVTSCKLIKFLALADCQITDSLLETMSRECSCIAQLCLKSCVKVSDKGIIALIAGCGNTFTDLMLDECVRITDRSVLAVAKHCPRLETFCVGDCSHVNHSAMKILIASCPRLKTLTIHGTKVNIHEVLKDWLHGAQDIVCANDDPSDSPDNADADLLLRNSSRGLKQVRFQSFHFVLNMSSLCASIGSCGVDLQVLEMTGFENKLTDKLLLSILNKCPMLVKINIINNPELTGKSVLNISAKCAHLHTLEVNRMPDLTDEIISVLVTAHPQQFKNLSFGQCGAISDVAVQQIAKHCSSTLLDFCVAGSKFVTDASVLCLARHCKLLRHLDLQCCPLLTDRIWDTLQFYALNLRSLQVHMCHLLTVQRAAEFVSLHKLDSFGLDKRFLFDI